MTKFVNFNNPQAQGDDSSSFFSKMNILGGSSGSFFNNTTLLYVIIAVLFIALVVYVYYYVIKPASSPSFVPNNELAEKSSNEAELMLFYVDWCPHCKTAMPEWNKFKNEMNNTEVNGYKLVCVEYNCTTESTEIKKLISKYNIEGYPTVKLIKNNEIYDFDAKPTVSYLKQFCYTMI